jgi:hypothetical protein
MKITYSLFTLLFVSCLSSFGQTKGSQKEQTTKDSLKSTYSLKATLADRSMEKESGNEKSLFGNYINGVAGLLSTNSGSVNLQGSLRGIFMTIVGKGNDTLDSNYTKHAFVRNMAINLGFTPNKKPIINVDTINFGLTYSILNNKIAKAKVWKEIYKAFSISKQRNIDSILANIDQELLNVKKDYYHSKMLENFMNSNGTDTIEIYRDVPFRKYILEYTHAHFLSELYSAYNKIVNDYSDKISKQWLWTLSTNGKYELHKTYVDAVIISSTIYKVFYANNKKAQQYSFQLVPSYTKTTDTLEKTKNLKRDYLSFKAGLNFKICKCFEINLSGSWQHIIDGLYTKENIDQYTIEVTPRLKINKNFWLPVTVKYDIKHPQFFGFLSLEFSLK